MYRLNNIKQNILIISSAALLVGCGGGSATGDVDTNLTSTPPTDKRLPATTPTIADTTENSITIKWNQANGYTSKRVVYDTKVHGTSKKYAYRLPVEEEGTITLINLQADTTYHYRIVAEDKNGREVQSEDRTFATLEPIATEPIVTEPVPAEPIATEPAPTDPIVTEPAPTEPIVTEPVPTEPIIAEPVPTEPIVTEPAPTVTEPLYGAELVQGGENDNGTINKYDWIELGDLYGIKTRLYNNNTFLYPNQKSNNGGCYQAIPTVVGKQYKVSAILLGTDANTNEIFSSSSASYITIDSSVPTLNGVPDHLTNMVTGSTETAETFIFTATATTSYISLRSTKAYNYPNARAISVKELIEAGAASTEPNITDPTPEPTPICKSGPAMQQGQVKDSSSGIGLANVAVMIAGCTTQTDVDGFYTLQNIAVSEEAVVNFEKEGYLLGSTKIQIKELSGDNTTSSNYLEYAIDTYDWQWSHDSNTRRTGAHIDIPASVYTDTTGDLYDGVVSAALEFQDVTTDTEKALFPGFFEGQNANGEMQQFVSHGIISLYFKDTNGNPLNFSEGTIATLTFDAVASMEGQNILPLWYYDYHQGLWIEEGYAELQTDGDYKGEISHPGTWSLNQPVENAPGIYTGRILNADGLPISDVRVNAIGNNWISKDLSTDEDGVFEIEVIPGKSFQLTAYNYKDKYGAMYNVTISAIASGDIIGNE